jgi:hypothetical protein
MANVDRVAGFIPVGTTSGSDYKASIVKCYVPSSDDTAIAVGDAVKLAGSSDAAGTSPTVTAASAGDYVYGIVDSVENAPSAANVANDLTKTYRPASTAQYIYVITDPDLVCEIQEDSVGGALAATSVGLNADFIAGGVDTAAQTSGMELDSNTADTTASLGLQILGLVDRPDNAIGTNAKWRVRFNLHALRNGTTGV